MGFTPTVWPEDRAPSEAINYKQCEVYTPKLRIVWGEGNPMASIIIILDNPGAREDREGKEYVCGTRRTLQTALYKANLIANDIYVTYLLKCRPLRSYDKVGARAFSRPFLEQQINTINPRYIVCLGDVVTQSIFGDSEVSVKYLWGLWHDIMDYPTIVSYHPLAVRRRPNLMKLFM